MESDARERLIEKIGRVTDGDEAVTRAMKRVPREHFVSAELRSLAYKDAPLPIGDGQTISQPTLVAFMTSQLKLKADSRVLEIGTGCGYQTAILCELAAEVYSIEIRNSLSEEAGHRLTSLGYSNFQLRVGNGSFGWPEASPFDAILVAAVAKEVPCSLLDQLKDGGVMILPLQESACQRLIYIEKSSNEIVTHPLFEVRFVPLVEQI